MRRLCGSIILSMTLMSLLFAWQESEKLGNLTVIIDGIENNDGKILIALNNSKEDYETKGQAFRGVTVDITNQKALFTFENICYGVYAIKTFHDENTDGELDSNFLGMPTENYGFSNDARGSFGPANWEDAKFNFDVQRDTARIKIE